LYKIQKEKGIYIVKPVWFLAFQKTKSWLKLYSGKIDFGFFRKSFCDEYKKADRKNEKGVEVF
jgi:hypothetical protein